MTQQSHITQAGHALAYHQTIGNTPGILFCGGFRSNMESTKVTALGEWCEEKAIGFTRFDYHGHGKSGSTFEQFTIGQAVEDAIEMLDHIATGPQILVGSSMGAWIALRAAQERKGQVKGFIGIASAPDFTERLMFARMTPEQRRELEDEGKIWGPSDYGSDYPITQNFIHEARNHLLLDDVIGLNIPMILLHGQEDMDVPWETSMELAKQVISDNVTLTLIKDGDHRLNRPSDIALLTDAVTRMLGNN